jgi:AbiV family abortive infection protein
MSDDANDELETLVTSNPILANAFRLFRDADLLHSAGSYPTTIALAVLAFEEIGKYLLETWSAQDPAFSYKGHSNYHQSKQAATAALFLTEDARREFRARKPDGGYSENVEGLTDMARAMIEGLRRRTGLVNAINGRLFDRMKNTSLYYDEGFAKNGPEPTSKDAADIMGMVSRAFTLLVEKGNVEIAKFVFPVTQPKRPVRAKAGID